GVLVGPFYLVVGLIQAFVRDGFDLGRHALSLLAEVPWPRHGAALRSEARLGLRIGRGYIRRPSPASDPPFIGAVTMRRSIVLAPLAMLLAAGSLAAQEARNSLNIQIGTLGIGAEFGRLLTGHLGVRVGGSFFRYGYDFTQDDIDYETDLEFQDFRA